MTSEGTSSAQRLNEIADIEESQRQFMDSMKPGRIVRVQKYDDESEPMTTRKFAALMLIWLASWVVVGGLIYGAFKIAEAMQ